MYDLNSLLIAGILFVSMALAIEIGFRIGKLTQRQATESFKTQINTIQASLLGVLALLLGFTFSLALQRFDTRSSAVVDEANTIGTTYLRADFLPMEKRDEARELLRQYLGLRLEAGHIAMIDDMKRSELLNDARQVQAALWELAGQAVALDDRPVTTGLFIQSLNALIDALEVRDAALNRHVPEVVLLLLYGTFLMTGSIVGYASGVSNHRASYITYVMVGLIVLLVFVIIDLDRPRRGVIEVSQKSLQDLYTNISRQD